MDKQLSPLIRQPGLTKFSLKKKKKKGGPQDINKFRVEVKAPSSVQLLDLCTVTLHSEECAEDRYRPHTQFHRSQLGYAHFRNKHTKQHLLTSNTFATFSLNFMLSDDTATWRHKAVEAQYRFCIKFKFNFTNSPGFHKHGSGDRFIRLRKP
jgi:hypothetical protein